MILLGAGSAKAQTEESLRATIPFDFKIGQMTLPAGRYDVSCEAVEIFAPQARVGLEIPGTHPVV